MEAAVFFVVGVLLAVAPGLALPSARVAAGGAVHYPVWVRIAGVEAIGLAMLMTMVAHRVESLWWWSWSFAIVSISLATVFLLNAAFGLAPGQSAAFWWSFAAGAVVLGLGLLYGLFVSSREQPIP